MERITFPLNIGSDETMRGSCSMDEIPSFLAFLDSGSLQPYTLSISIWDIAFRLAAPMRRSLTMVEWDELHRIIQTVTESYREALISELEEFRKGVR